MRMPDGVVIDDNEYHWGAFLAGLRQDGLKEVVLVLDGAEPFPCVSLSVI